MCCRIYDYLSNNQYSLHFSIIGTTLFIYMMTGRYDLLAGFLKRENFRIALNKACPSMLKISVVVSAYHCQYHTAIRQLPQ